MSFGFGMSQSDWLAKDKKRHQNELAGQKRIARERAAHIKQIAANEKAEKERKERDQRIKDINQKIREKQAERKLKRVTAPPHHKKKKGGVSLFKGSGGW